MKDTILVCTARGEVELTVQTRDVEAHAALSNDHEGWQAVRRELQVVVERALAPKETR